MGEVVRDLRGLSMALKCRLVLLLIGTAVFGLPSFSHAARPCTDGVDCYCDRVSGGDLNDPGLIFCEDWEAVTLHDDVNFGGGPPLYGPWYDDTGYTGNWGNNSYWGQHYGMQLPGRLGNLAAAGHGTSERREGTGACLGGQRGHQWIRDSASPAIT